MSERESSEFHRSSDVRFRMIGDEAVVLRQRAAEVVVLNQVGGRILELADGRSAPEIVELLLEEFEVPRGELERDVAEFLATLESRGILERVEEAPPPAR